MRRQSASGILLASLLLATVASTGRAWADEKVAGERLLPPDVYLFAEIPSVPELKARWQKTLMGRIAADPALADFRKDIEAQLEQLSQQAEQEVGVSLNDLLSVPSGQVTLAVLRVSSGAVGFATVLDYGENDATIDKLLATAAKKLGEKGATRKEEDVDGTTVVVYSKAEQDKKVKGNDGNDAGISAEQSPMKTLAYFHRDKRLVLASALEIAKSVLARWDGKHATTFADNEVHQYILKRCSSGEGQPALSWYIEPLGLVSAVLETTGQNDQQAMALLGLAENLGLKQLKAVGGTVDFSVGNFDSITKSLVCIEGEPRGILKLLRLPEAELSPPKWVPASVVSYVTYNWDIAGAYAAAESLFDSIRGPGEFAALIDQLSTQPGGPQIHLKRDFLDHLTGRVHMVSALPSEGSSKPRAGSQDPQEEDAIAPPANRTLIVFDGKEGDKLRSLLKTLADSPDFQGKSREFQGSTLYELPALPGFGTTGAAAIVNNSLMVTTDVGMIEQVLRTDKDEPSLVDSAEYRRLAEKFPSKTSLLGFQRQAAQLETVYEMFRTGNSPVPVEGLNLSKLPPFGEIKKYLPATGLYAVPDERGGLYVTFTLPDKEN